MKKVRLTKRKKKILQSLSAHTYPTIVPVKDYKNFLSLESMGFVMHLETDQSITELYGPELTEMGIDYLKFNPGLKNPFWITKEDIISFLAQVSSNLMKP